MAVFACKNIFLYIQHKCVRDCQKKVLVNCTYLPTVRIFFSAEREFPILSKSSTSMDYNSNLNSSYYPNYFSIDDILVTQEKVQCTVNTKLVKMGFLDPGSETEDLEAGKTINLPLWYIKELKSNNPYFTVEVPEIYKNVHKAVCEAETTNIELGQLHPFFYEYGRYLTPYDRSNVVGRIVFETMRQRVRHLLDVAITTSDDAQPEHRLELIENHLYRNGFKNWLQFKGLEICPSEMVQEHSKKRKRHTISDDENNSPGQSSKRSSV